MNTYKSIARKIILFALVIWFIFSVLFTWAAAKDMKSDMQNGLSTLLWSEYYSSSKPLPGQFEYDCIKSFHRPYSEIGLSPLLPLQLTKYRNFSSDDWIYGKWHAIYGYEAALGFYDTEFQPLFTQGNYLTFEYITEEDWQNKTLQSKGYAYINLDQYPQLKEMFESTPLGNFALDSLYSAFKMTGTLSDNEFIPASIERQDFSETYHPVDTPDLERIRALEDKNLIVWEPVIEPTDHPSSITIYAHHLYAYRYDYVPFNIDGKEMTLPEMMNDTIEQNQVHEKHSLIESTMTFSVQKSDGYIMAGSIRFWPLAYVLLRLIPFYLATLGITVLVLLCLLHFIRHDLKPND